VADEDTDLRINVSLSCRLLKNTRLLSMGLHLLNLTAQTFSSGIFAMDRSRIRQDIDRALGIMERDEENTLTIRKVNVALIRISPLRE